LTGAGLDSWYHEKESAWLYRQVAAAEPDPNKRALFLKLASAAEEQAGKWQLAAARGGASSAARTFAPALRARIVAQLLRYFEPRALRPVLAAMKLRGLSIYSTPSAVAGHAMPTSRAEVGARHRSPLGGGLRAGVFGVNDGLLSNVSLVLGVAGAGVSSGYLLTAGLAGLLAGALSMAAGEYVSVSSQNELIQAEVDKERLELEHNAVAEQAELAGMLRDRGVSPATARQAAAEISAHPEKALAVHALEELGVDPGDLPSPVVAAGASLGSFAIGALIPLLPYLFGLHVLWFALGLAAVAAVFGGGMVSRLTDRPFWRGALRQLVLGAVAAGITYLIGMAVGHIA